MSKIQRKRKNASLREEKISKPAASLENDEMETCLQSLSSSQESRRIKALQMLSNIYTFNSGNIKSLEKLSNADILQQLSRTLVDSSDVLKLEGISTIYSLISTNHQNIIQKLLDSDICDSIFASIRTFFRDSSSNSQIILKQLDCITGMIEITEQIFGKFDDSFLLTLLTALQSSSVSLEVRLSIAQLLFVLTDNNPQMSSRLLSLEAFPILASLCPESPSTSASTSLEASSTLENDLFYLKTCGCLLNLLPFLPSSSSSSSSTSSFNLVPRFSHILSLIGDHSRSSDSLLSLDVVQLGLELLTNLLAACPGGEEEEEEEEEGMEVEDREEGEEGDWEDVEEGCGDEKESTRRPAPTPSSSSSSATSSSSTSSSSVSSSSSSSNPFSSLSESLPSSSCLPTLSTALSLLSARLFALLPPPPSPALSLPGTQSSRPAPHPPLSLLSLKTTETLDRVASALCNFLSLPSLSLHSTPESLSTLSSETLSLLDLVLRGVENTSPSVDAEGKSTRLWSVEDSLDRAALCGVFCEASASSLQLLRLLLDQLISHSLPLPDPSSLTRLLSSSLSLPHLEIALPALDVCAALGSSSALPPAPTIELTRALLSRLANPSAVSKNKDIPPSSSTSSSSSLSLPSLQVLNGCMSALIDLHSSDDPQLFLCFQALNIRSSMVAGCVSLKKAISSPSAKSFGPLKHLFRDTLTNSKEFLKYKNEFKLPAASSLK